MKQKQENNGILVGGILAIAICMIITVAAGAIYAWLLLKGTMEESTMGYAVMIITAIAAFGGSLTAMKKVGHSLLLLSGGVGVVFFLVLCGINIVFIDGQFSGIWETALLIIGCCICTALICARNHGKKRNGKKRNR